MVASDEPPALAYIEKTFADAYRKEIDQEENVWRSLPFFAATLALQLATLYQVIDRLPDPAVWTGRLSVGLLTLGLFLTVAALGFMAAAIYPAKFDYVAGEPEILDYATILMRDEQPPQRDGPDKTFSAVATLKTTMAQHYARAVDHNRRINRRRERRRSMAGLAALGSVLITVLLATVTYAHYLWVRA